MQATTHNTTPPTTTAAAAPLPIALNIRTSLDARWNPTMTDWAGLLRSRVADLPFRGNGQGSEGDVRIIYDHEAGIYDRKSGAFTHEPGLMKRHALELARDLERIPEDFDGIVNLDYEGQWFVGDGPFEKAWFYTTMRTARAVRPRVKWGWWCMPLNWQSGEYERPNSPEKAFNDSIAWFYRQMDVICPVLYQKKPRLAPGKTRSSWHEWESWEHDTYCRSILDEAVRVAGPMIGGEPGKPRKPIVAWIWWKREAHPGSIFNGTTVSEAEMRAICEHARARLGLAHGGTALDGLALWEDLYSLEQVDAMEAWIRSVLVPAWTKP